MTCNYVVLFGYNYEGYSMPQFCCDKLKQARKFITQRVVSSEYKPEDDYIIFNLATNEFLTVYKNDREEKEWRKALPR